MCSGTKGCTKQVCLPIIFPLERFKVNIPIKEMFEKSPSCTKYVLYDRNTSCFHIIPDMSNSIVQHSDIIRTNILSLDNEAHNNMLSRIPYIDEVKNVVFNVDNWT